MNVGMKKTDLSQEFFTSSIKRSLLIATLLFSGLFAAINTTAQGISAADISALKGGAMLQGGSSGLGGSNLQGMLSIAVPTTGIQDDEATSQEGRKIQQPSLPLPPNEFQNYVIQTTGQWLPLYGANFFENLRNNNSQFTRSPVSDDYVIGPGDQLLIRVWGSTSAEATVTVDRQGAIAFPKLGTLRLAGVRAGQLDAIVKSYFNKFYKDIESKY